MKLLAMTIHSTALLSCMAGLLVMPSTSYAQTAAPGMLLAVSKHDHTLAIVDPGTLRVVARAPVGLDPHEVVASSDGKTAYVSIYGFGAYHALSVIDLVTYKALPDIDTVALNGPHGLFFSGGKLWFTAEGAKAVARFDPATSRFDWMMGTGQERTHMIYVSPDQNKVYTTNVSSGTVTVLEKVTLPPMVPPGTVPPAGTPPRIDWKETIIPVGRGDEGFDVTPDGRELWTANAQDGTVSVIELAASKVVATISANVMGANRLKFTLDGKLALISLLRGTDIVIYDALTRKEFKRVPIGHGASGILLEPNGRRAFIACGPDNLVAVLDLKTLEITGHIDVGGEPDGLAWSGFISPGRRRDPSARSN